MKTRIIAISLGLLMFALAGIGGHIAAESYTANNVSAVANVQSVVNQGLGQQNP